MKNTDNPSVTVEFDNGKRFDLLLPDAPSLPVSIAFDRPTYIATDSVPMGTKVKADTLGTNDYSALNAVGGATGDGNFAQDEEFDVTVANAIVPAGLSVTAIEIVPVLV